MTLYCSPRHHRQGTRHRRSWALSGTGGLSDQRGNSPNVQAEVGRLVGLLPIEQARQELARKGLRADEKAVRRTSAELGAQMLATRTRDLMRFRMANCLPAASTRANVSGLAWTAAESACELSRRTFASAASGKGRSSRLSRASPRLSFFRNGQERAESSGEVAQSSTARFKALTR